MYFLNRGDTDTYITIHKEDEQNFYDIINSGIFTKENKFRLIKDKAEIKKILEERYASRNRGEDYTAGLPSATLISSSSGKLKNVTSSLIPIVKWSFGSANVKFL